jgi:hypothetical protein
MAFAGRRYATSVDRVPKRWRAGRSLSRSLLCLRRGAAIGRLVESALINMTGWIIALLVSLVSASFALARVRTRRGSQFELGKVSQGWITEQRAGKHRDWS